MAHQAAFPTLGPMPSVTSPAPETVAFAVHRTTVPGAAPVVEQAAAVRAPTVIGQEPAIVEQAVLRGPHPSKGRVPGSDSVDDQTQDSVFDDDNFIDRRGDSDGRNQRETIIMRSDPTDFVRVAPVRSPSRTSSTPASPDFGNLTLIGVYR